MKYSNTVSSNKYARRALYVLIFCCDRHNNNQVGAVKTSRRNVVGRIAGRYVAGITRVCAIWRRIENTGSRIMLLNDASCWSPRNKTTYDSFCTPLYVYYATRTCWRTYRATIPVPSRCWTVETLWYTECVRIRQEPDLGRARQGSIVPGRKTVRILFWTENIIINSCRIYTHYTLSYHNRVECDIRYYIIVTVLPAQCLIVTSWVRRTDKKTVATVGLIGVSKTIITWEI